MAYTVLTIGIFVTVAGGGDKSSTPQSEDDETRKRAFLLHITNSSAFEASGASSSVASSFTSFGGNIMRDTVCETHTGGTCFWLDCANFRNASCRHSWESLQWHGCDCGEGQCAGPDGICRSKDTNKLPYTFEAWLRQESYSRFIMVVVLLGRSGLDGLLMSKTGLDRMTSAHHNIRTKPMAGKQFWDIAEEQELNVFQVCVVCTTKLIFWHLGQVIFFWVAWLAYKRLMGWWQYGFATVVVLKEAWYAYLLGYGTIMAPKFLLFAPFSASSMGARIMYFASPDDFVARAIFLEVGRRSEAHGYIFGPLTVFINFLGGACALVAIMIGLFGNGVMFPSLFAGYLLSAVSPLGAMLSIILNEYGWVDTFKNL